MFDIHRFHSSSNSPAARLLVSSGLVHVSTVPGAHHDLLGVIGTHPLPITDQIRDRRERWTQAVEVPVQGAIVAADNQAPGGFGVGRERLVGKGRAAADVACDQAGTGIF